MNPFAVLLDDLTRLRISRQNTRRLKDASFSLQTALVALKSDPDSPLTQAVAESAVTEANYALAIYEEHKS